MNYYRVTQLTGKGIAPACCCCADKIKGKPRWTHRADNWQPYCPRCYRECRPYPDKTGCYQKGGVNQHLTEMQAAHSHNRSEYLERIKNARKNQA